MRTPRRRSGQGTLELALVLPVFMLIIIAIYDFAIAMHVWSNLNQAAIAGAREGSKRVMALYPVYRYKSSPNLVKDTMMNNLSPFVKRANFQVGYDPKVTPVTVATGVMKLHVVVRYNHSLITPLLGSLVGGSNGDGRIVLSAEVDADLD